MQSTLPESISPPDQSSELLQHILEPYKPHCRYLLRAVVYPGEQGGALVSSEGEFSIPESCYIDDTGHFNAVEFNICFNQLAYYMLAECVQRSLLEIFDGWTLAEYKTRQLSDFLIVRFESAFKSQMRARLFSGRVGIDRIFTRGRTNFLKTSCNFEDGHGGSSRGGALLGIIDGAAR